jgi:hypothetical protein
MASDVSVPCWIRGEEGGLDGMDHPEMTCEAFREDLPLLVAVGDALPAAMARHRDGCEPCRREEELVRGLFLLRPEPPAELAGAISAALRTAPAAGAERTAPGSAGGWGVSLRFLLPVAALLVAALGTVLMWGGAGSPTTTGAGPAIAAAEGSAGGLDGMHLWPSANGMVAGEPLLLLDGLTEEQLEALLAEMEG